MQTIGSSAAEPSLSSLGVSGGERNGEVHDQTIQVLKSAVQKARLGRAEELGALKRLDDQARQLERHATGPTVQELIAQEPQRSTSYGGRSVFGCEHGQTSGKIGDSGGR